MGQKAVVDANLQAVVEKFAERKKESYGERTDNGAVPWFRPPLEKWDGALQTEGDLINIHQAFNTDQAEEKLTEAFNPQDPGNSGDGIVLPLQIDYMAQAERAYRARATQSFPRMLAHLSTREKGHGQANGVFLGQALRYFTLLVKQAADGAGGSV